MGLKQYLIRHSLTSQYKEIKCKPQVDIIAGTSLHFFFNKRYTLLMFTRQYKLKILTEAFYFLFPNIQQKRRYEISVKPGQCSTIKQGPGQCNVVYCSFIQYSVF